MPTPDVKSTYDCKLELGIRGSVLEEVGVVRTRTLDAAVLLVQHATLV